MFKLKKSKESFVFYENNNKVIVYKKSLQSISGVEEIYSFDFENLEKELDKIKKEFSEIIDSKIVFILNARLENIEKTDLPKEDLVNYIKWKIQEIIDLPLSDVCFDLLSNNNSQIPFFKKYATVVIEKKQKIQFIVDSFSKNKLNLLSIDHNSTAAIEAILKNVNLIKQKSFAILNLDSNQLILQIFYNDGIVFERNVELNLNVNSENELTENEYEYLFDKICLEMQRNIDYVDRQYGVPHFENILYITPKKDFFVKLKAEIAKNFNVGIVDSNNLTVFKPKENNEISFFALAAFEKDSLNSEQINLKPIITKEVNFSEDFKKVFAVSLVISLCFAGFGSVYEVRGKDVASNNIQLIKNNDFEKKKIEEEKNSLQKTNKELESSISILTKQKAEIIEFNGFKYNHNKSFYQDLMKDLAIAASKSAISLDTITVNESGIFLYGKTLKKDNFITYLNYLKDMKDLKGKEISNVLLEQKGNIFIFRISSLSVGENK